MVLIFGNFTNPFKQNNLKMENNWHTLEEKEKLEYYHKQKVEFETLPPEEFIKKNYKLKFWLERWKRFWEEEGKKIILLMEGKSNESLFYTQNIDLSKLRSFYRDVADFNLFPEDIVSYFVKLEAEGFFDYYKINFQEWITMKNYLNPENNDEYSFDVNSPKEWIEYHELGADVLRIKLDSGLIYWRTFR